MKKNLLTIGLIFLGISIIISACIISKPLGGLIYFNHTLAGTLDGTLSVEQPDSSNYQININNKSDILQTEDAGRILGYSDNEKFIRDMGSGELKGIPYTRVSGHYLFSKKALDEWIYSNSMK